MPNHVALCEFPIERLRRFEAACIEVQQIRRRLYREFGGHRNLRRLKQVNQRLDQVQIAIYAKVVSPSRDSVSFFDVPNRLDGIPMR